MSNKLALRPSYWASVSGGKDSLYMLYLILHNLDRYPLDGVVHYELEIDYPFIRDVIDYMEKECKKCNIKFVRIKPRKTWEEWYYTKRKSKRLGVERIMGFPTRICRWCNSKYKLDAKKQLDEFMETQGCYVIHYIGYCADEKKRYNKRNNVKEVYPLVDFGIEETEIWEWAKKQPIFNNYYKQNKRCGCMYCPMSPKIAIAYLYKYYPDNFDYMISKMRETEKLLEVEYGRPISVSSDNPKYNADYLENIIKTKWIKKLNEMEVEENVT